MKKLLFILLAVIIISKLNAQCSVATPTLSEAFTGTVLPTCWSFGANPGTVNNQVSIYSNSGINVLLITPKVNNARGIITFDAKRNTSTSVASPVQVGVVSGPGGANQNSFVLLQSVNTTYTMTTYTVNLSSYTGSYQYIALRSQGPSMVSGDVAGFTIDNVNYVSGCESSSVTAIAQNYSLQLNAAGMATLSANQINNGSSSGCGTPSLSISKTKFNCGDLGLNTITLTATDNMGNTATAISTVNVTSIINDEIISASQNSICTGKTVTITTASSVPGINYYLRDDITNNTIVGPIVGTGSPLSFNTGTLNVNSSFNVYAETKPFYYGVDLDGTNDYINLSTNNRNITNVVTVSARIKTSTSNVTQYVVDKYTSGSLGFLLTIDAYTGKARFDGRDGGTTYKTSGPSITNVANNQWHEVTGVLRNTGWEIYVDGVLENSGAYSFGGTGVTNAGALAVGSYSTSYSGLMIDNLTIWNTSLTQTQIQSNIATCLTGSEANLVGYFKFDEGNGLSVTDASTVAVNGTITNGNNTVWVNSTPGACSYPVSCPYEMSTLININVNPLPLISVVSTNTLICAGETVTLTASGASTYTWNPGGNAATQVAPLTSTQNFTVLATDVNGCNNSTVFTQSVSVCTDINENFNQNSITIYPNPAKSVLTIQSDEFIEKIQVYNLLGKVVLTDSSTIISVEALNAGVYFLDIYSKKGKVTKRFVKE